MKVNIKSTKIKLTPQIKEHVQEKMDMLEKYLGKIQVLHCDVELSREKVTQNNGEIYRAEVNLELPQEMLRIEKTEDDLIKALEKVKDHLARSIKKYKERRIDKNTKIV